MKIKNKIVAFLALFILGGLVMTTTVNADEKEQTQPNQTYQVIPITPKNQDKDVVAYFRYPWKPGETEELGVRIKNNTDKVKSFKIMTTKAITNRNGLAIYDSTAQNDAEGIQFPKLVEFPEKVEVQPNSEVEIKKSYVTPDENIEGLIMGGIYIIEDSNDSEKDAKSGTITQKVAFALPVFIYNPETYNKNDLDLKFEKFSFEKIGSGLFSIKTPFKNVTPYYISKGTLSVKVVNDKGETVIDDEKEITVTPTSKIDLGTEFKKELPAGDYKVTFSLKHKDKEWTETQTVKIDKEKEKEITNTMKPKEPIDWYKIALLVLVALIIIGFIVSVIRKQMNKSKEAKEKMNKKSSNKSNENKKKNKELK